MMKLNILNFGGGVQSTVLVLMAAKGEIERPDYVVFADTGNESAATYHHVWKTMEFAVQHGLVCVVVGKGNIRDDVLKAASEGHLAKPGRVGQPPFFVKGLDGSASVLWRKCSSEYKITPIQQWLRQTMGVAKGKRFPKGFQAVKWLGITIDEASRMKPSRNYFEISRWPLIELNMTRWDCHRYLKAAGWGVVPKSSCLICPYHDNEYWRIMRDTSPEEWASVVDFEKQLHQGRLAGTRSAAFLHRSCVPLSDVDLRTDVDRGQYALNLWAGECEGICGT